MHSEEEGDLDADLVKRGYVKKLKKTDGTRPCSECRRVDCKRDQEVWAIGSRDMALTNFPR